MAREEKFNLLNELLEYEENNDIGNLTRAERREFQQWISEALEQQSCEDAISREQAIDAIKKIHPVDTEYDCTLYDKVDVMYVLEDLPSVQPKYNASEWCHDCKEYNQDKHCCSRYNKVIRNAVEEMKEPKIGHWIDHSDEGYVECPFCGHATNCEDNIDELHYCFHCGAKMVKSNISEIPTGLESEDKE